MDFLPWTTFTRIVDRYGGESPGRGRYSCADSIPVHGLRPARPTGKALRDNRDLPLGPRIETLSHGLRASRSGRFLRRWPMPTKGATERIHAALAQRLITQARTLYVDEELGLDLDQYRLRPGRPTTLSSLCLNRSFRAAHFLHHQGGGEDAHAARFSAVATFRVFRCHISDCRQAARRFMPSTYCVYAGSRSHLPMRGSCAYVDFARLYVLHQAGAFFVTRAKSNIDAHRVYSAPTDRSTGIICDSQHHLPVDALLHPSGFAAQKLLRACITSACQGPRVRQDAGSSSPTTSRFRPPPSARSTKAAGRWKLFFKWIKQHLRIKQFYGTS